MTDQPMSEERLAEIEASKITWPYVTDLVREVRRLRGKDQDLDVLRMAYDEKVRLLEDVAPQLLSDPDLWDTMRSERDRAKATANRLRSVLFAIGKMSSGGLREWALKEARSDD